MRIPLGIKISLGTVTMVLVTVVLLLINTYNYLVTNEIDNLKQEVHITISRLQQTVEFLLQKNENEEVQVELSALGSIRHMKYAFLVGEDNKIVASSQLAYIGRDVSETFVEHASDSTLSGFNIDISPQKSKLWVSDDGNTLFAVYPVFFGLKSGEKLIENKVGYIGAHIDLRWILSEALETLQVRTIPVVFIILVMGVLVAFLYNYLLVRRINYINSAAEKFAASGYKARALVTGNDEISDLANVFNEMAVKVEIQSAELVKNEENIALIIDSMEGGVITIDENGLICSFNKSAERMFGYSSAEIIGGNVNRLMPEPYHSIHDDILKKYMETGQKHVIGIGRDLPARHKDGHIFSIHLSVNELPKRAGGERLFIGSCLDITLLKEQQQQLRHSQKMDALGKLTGGIAHDYNNMLGVILGYSELLLDKLSDEPKLKKYITEIYHAGQRGAKLTQKLLSFSRQKNTSPDVANINLLLENNKNMLEKTLTARIELVYKLNADLWSVYIDKSDLEDALLNMCINSMHAIEHSGRLILSTENCQLNRINVDELKLGSGPGDYVCLSVQDTGSGIDENTLARIFDPFFTTKGEQGNGLGLSQVYGFVNRSKGAIKVESSNGLGSCFKLYFPRYTGDEIDNSLSMKIQDVDEGNETILVVDDEPSLRSLLNEMLSSYGYKVIVAESAEQAIELLKKQPVDLMLSDVIMPGMNGYKLAEYVSMDYPEVKIQLVSGYSDNSHNSEQHELHNNVLYKPLERKTLLARIRKLLDDHNAQHKEYFVSIRQNLTGIRLVDEEHSKIIDMVNECSRLIEKDDDMQRLDMVIEKLLSFTDQHFSREELLLEKCGHSNIKQCKSTHEFLLKTLRNTYNQYKSNQIKASDLMVFLNDWLQDHMSGLDTNILMPLLESDNKVVKVALSEFDENRKG